MEHERNKNKWPALGKRCSNCKKKNHFQVVCNYKRRLESVEGTDPPTENTEVSALNTPTKTREKIKLNGIFFIMPEKTKSFCIYGKSNLGSHHHVIFNKIGKEKIKNQMEKKQNSYYEKGIRQ